MRRTAPPWVGALLLLGLSVMGAGCAGPQVQRLGAAADVGATWNAEDARLVATALIRDCLQHAWLPALRERLGRRPRVIAGRVRNQTPEHLDTSSFVLDLQRALINSQQVDWVASGSARAQIREERLDQQLNAAEEEGMGEFGKEAGADLQLSGVVSAQLDSDARREGINYKVVLQFAEVGSGRLVWTGEQSVHKVRRRD